MKTDKEKIALHEFAKKLFGIKMQPYQKQIIELIEKGGKRSLRLKPTLVQIRPPSSIKLRKRLLSGIHEIKDLMKDIENQYADFPLMTHDDFQKEYQCEFKSDIEIIHYDDFHHGGAKAQIGLAEFGNDRGYIVDCVVMNFRSGDPRVSYYANLSDFTGHPKWDYENCFVVCFDERYKRDNKSETK